MADITEVIHRITYEVNNEALINATKSIQFQVAELHVLGKELDSYTKILSRLQGSEVKQLDELSRKIDATGKQIAASAGKTEGILRQVFKGVLKGLDIDDNLKDAVGKYVSSIRSKFTELGQATEHITDGINSMFTSTSTLTQQNGARTSSAIEKLGKSMLGTTGLIDIGITALSLLGEELLKEGGIIEEFVKGEQEIVTETEKIILSFTELTSKVSDIASAELVNSKLLYETATDINQAYATRIQAVDELQERYPEYFGNLSQEAILAGEAAGMYNELNQAIVARAQVDVYKEELKELVKQQRVLERNTQLSRGLSEATRISSKKIIDYDVSSSVNDESIRREQKLNAKYEAEKTRNLEEQKTISARILEIQKSIKVASKPSSNVIHPAPVLKKDKTVQNAVERKKEETLDPLLLSNQKETTLSRPEVKPIALYENEEKQKGLTEAQRNNIKEGIEGYQQLAQAAAEAYNAILQAQIAALDKEISIREKRVEEAKKLAERGNTEVLRLEEERLRKSQEQREHFARKQQIVNAAITVSNSIAAVARAALEGGGFGSAATIAALIAAIAAGYAAVTSMSNENAFADGVVGYQGVGGPRDDKNHVRISNGESVITAEGTQKNRALLEAINKGAVLHMIDPTLPVMMPMFKQPGSQSNNYYAATKDLKRLESKLDEVVGAIEDNKLRQNIFFNEQGVGVLTERAIRRDRKRWK